MRCCIVRHGETAWNADRRLQGHQDVPLNGGLGPGRSRRTLFAESPSANTFATIVSSDLMRARQTADEIAHALGMAVVSDPGLRERHYGQFEGKTQTEAEAQNPADYAALVARAELDAAPGGASLYRECSNVLSTPFGIWRASKPIMPSSWSPMAGCWICFIAVPWGGP